MKITCPLQLLHDPTFDTKVYLKRLDLLPWGGGNKVPRFDAFFREKGPLQRVAVMSDPGSHSFHILSHYLEREGEAGAASLLFLERRRPMTPYQAELRRRYLNRPEIRVIPGNQWIHLLRTLYYHTLKDPPVHVMGMGGHVRTKENPYESLFSECVDQLAGDERSTEITHLFPIASGNMADGFLEVIRRKQWTNHRLWGVMTGDPLTRPWLRLRFRKEKTLTLIRSESLNEASYWHRARKFYDDTGIWPDPTHTIHLLNTLDKKMVQNSGVIIVWITQPLADGPMIKLMLNQ